MLEDRVSLLMRDGIDELAATLSKRSLTEPMTSDWGPEVLVTVPLPGRSAFSSGTPDVESPDDVDNGSALPWLGTVSVTGTSVATSAGWVVSTTTSDVGAGNATVNSSAPLPVLGSLAVATGDGSVPLPGSLSGGVSTTDGVEDAGAGVLEFGLGSIAPEAVTVIAEDAWFTSVGRADPFSAG
jgi:hypothetical protein